MHAPGRRDVAWVMLSLAALAVLSVIQAPESLWLDEGLSVRYARADWADLWDAIDQGQLNQALYFVLLRGWLHVTEGEEGMRLLSLVLVGVAVPLIHLTASRLFGELAARWSTLLFSVNGLVVAFSREVRGYALVILLVTLATWLFVRMVQDGSRRGAVLYGVCAGLAAYAHFFAVLAIVAHLLSLVLLSRREIARSRLLPWGAVPLVLLLVPILGYTLTHSTSGLAWIGPLTPSNLAGTVAVLAGGLAGGRAQATGDVAAGVGVLMAFAVVVGVATMRLLTLVRGREADADRWRWGFSLLLSLLPFAVSVAVSLVGSPILHYRYLVVAIPGIVLLLGGVATLQLSKRLRVLVLASLLVIGVVAAGESLRCGGGGCERENFEDATAYVTERDRPGDAVVIYARSATHAYTYYAGRRNAGDAPDIVSDQAPAVEAAVADRDRIWLYLSHDTVKRKTKAYSQRLRSTLSEQHEQVLHRQFRGVDVYLYERGDGLLAP